jgi:hypothetical protein
MDKVSKNIILISSAASTVIFLMALVTKGALKDFLINISAGILTVVFTVLFVDRLRSEHQRRQYAIPQKSAINQIRASSYSLILSMAIKIYGNKSDFATDFINAGNESNNGNMEALSNVHLKYAKKMALLSPNDLLKNYSHSELTDNLKVTLGKLKESLENTHSLYGFTFIDASLGNDVADLINKADGAHSIFVAANLDKSTLTQIMKPTKDATEEQKNTDPLNILIGSVLKSFLESYVQFVDKYSVE